MQRLWSRGMPTGNATRSKIRQERQVANDVRAVMAYLVGGFGDLAFSEWDGKPLKVFSRRVT